MGVKGVSPVEDAADLKTLPADERVEQALHKTERYVPSAGPTMH
jgi:hypothetical protein